MNRNSRQSLIDIILDIPGVRDDPKTRNLLRANLPDRLLDNLQWNGTPLGDVTTLVDAVIAWGGDTLEAWLDNAWNLAGDSKAGRDLQAWRQHKIVGATLQPPPPPSLWADRPEYSTYEKELLNGGSVGGSVNLAISGRGGLGKTALAAKLAADLAIRATYPDGVFWVGLGPQPDIMTMLASLGGALGGNVTAYTDEESRAAAVRALLVSGKYLLIWDDVWTEDVAILCRDLRPTAALLTTRRHDVARVFAARRAGRLRELSTANSVGLLRDLVTVEVEQAVLERVVALAGGLPLSLGLLAGLLDDEAQMGWGLDTFLADLETPARRKNKLAAEYAIVAKSVDVLAEDDYAAFVDLAVFGPRPGTFDLSAATAVWQVDEAVARDRLRRFVARSLVDAEGAGRFALHLSLYDAAATRLEDVYPDLQQAIQDLQSPHRRHTEYYLALINRDRTDWQTIAAELDQIRRAWEVVAPDANLTLAFVFAMGLFHSRQGLWRQDISWMKERGLAAVRGLNRRQQEGWLLNSIGWTYDRLGEKQAALNYLEQARSIWKDMGDDSGLITTLHTIGWVYSSGLGEHLKALTYLEQAQSLAQAVDDKTGLAATLHNMGWAYANLGEHQKALAHLEHARITREQIRDYTGLAATLHTIGWVHNYLGEPQRALEYLLNSKKFAEDIGDRAMLVNTLHTIGWVYSYGLGEHQQALQYLEQARELAERIGDHSGLSAIWNNVGAAYIGLGEPQRALGYLEKAQAARRNIGDRTGLAVTLENMGYAHEALGNLPEAERCLENAVTLAELIRSADLPRIRAALAQLNQKLKPEPQNGLSSA
jgi:tetratricopeptide (TPR) repeat protein